MATIPGTINNDTLIGDNSALPGNFNDVISGDNGDDLLIGLTANDTLNGQNGNDTLDGGTGNDRLFGGSDNDVLIGGAGADSLDGGAGTSDTASYVGSAAVAVTVNGGATGGDAAGDTLTGIENLLGSSFNDTLTGDSGNNRLDGAIGNDRAYGRAGIDTLVGGTGNDTLFGGTGVDIIDAGADDDRVYGGTGQDQIFGGNGNDELYGGEDSDLIEGGLGGDTIFGGTGGNDTLRGNDGFDFVAYSGVAGNVTVSLVSNTATGADGTDNLAGFEGVLGGYGNDSITGDGFANRLVGGAGQDTINAGDGNDTVEGGLGNDTLAGQGGIDTLSYRGATTGVNVNMVGGTASGEGTDTFTGFENLTGSGHNDTLAGDNNANVITGGDGRDAINAAGGTDTIFGGVGNDTVDGGTGDDIIYGGSETGTIVDGTATSNLDFNWSALPAASLAGGVSQDTGGIIVNVDYVAGPVGTGGVRSSNLIYNNSAAGETFSTTSSAFVQRFGGSDEPSEVNINFAAAANSGLDGEVRNVQFRISDIDQGAHQDRVTVIAYDAAGNRVPVTFTSGFPLDVTILGDTIAATGTGGNSPDGAADASVLVTIPGPVARIEIQYDNIGGNNQHVHISDIQFQAVRELDDDSLAGAAGNDTIFGGIGNDTLDGGDNDDRLFGGLGNDEVRGGAGADSIEGGDGNDTILFGEGADTVFGGDGSDLIDDVGGIQLAGVNLVYGGSGNDTVYTGDGADLLFGDAGNDVLYGENGNDTITGGTGNDTVYGDEGNDRFIVGLNDVNTVAGGDVDTIPAYEVIYGGGGPGVSDGDNDTIDLSAFGFSRVEIVYSSSNVEDGYIKILDTAGVEIGRIDFFNIENVFPCFTPGVKILTDRGEVPVEALVPGDLVMTRDNGLQPLRWVGRRDLGLLDLMADPDLQPIEIAQGALHMGPDRVMRVSPQHRVLIEGARAELMFGEAEVLVAAKHLLGQAGVTRVLPLEGVAYIHILFDRHEIVQSDGVWTESFQPAERMLSAMDAEVRAEVLKLFPQLAVAADAFPAARLSLKAHEARVLLAG
jgi:Ca2+-binding RTX toxin-like protein